MHLKIPSLRALGYQKTVMSSSVQISVSLGRGKKSIRGLLWRLFGLRAFADLSDQKLADHRWALQSALFRAVRLLDGKDIDRLRKLHEAMEREMRIRGLL